MATKIKLVLVVLALPLITGGACSKYSRARDGYFYCQFKADSLKIENLELKDAEITCEEAGSEANKEQRSDPAGGVISIL